MNHLAMVHGYYLLKHPSWELILQVGSVWMMGFAGLTLLIVMSSEQLGMKIFSKHMRSQGEGGWEPHQVDDGIVMSFRFWLDLKNISPKL